ncbi:MAG TPA: hypothetical protein VFX33_17270 [Actinomycetales bacterium]|nr:hypothetical protein [Actinomycetales bacterium]
MAASSSRDARNSGSDAAARRPSTDRASNPVSVLSGSWLVNFIADRSLSMVRSMIVNVAMLMKAAAPNPAPAMTAPPNGAATAAMSAKPICRADMARASASVGTRRRGIEPDEGM